MHHPSFRPEPGLHCETTMLVNMLGGAGLRVSEPLLFGLGQGIDLQHLPSPGPGSGPSMLTGRIEPLALTRNACAALGVRLVDEQPSDPQVAENRAIDLLTEGRVVGVTVDIFHLDYFASKRHFSAHCIALLGLEDGVVRVVDTAQQGGVLLLPVRSLRLARASDEGFMPSPNQMLHVTDVRLDAPLEPEIVEECWRAAQSTAMRMLSDRGPDLGIAGLQTARESLVRSIQETGGPWGEPAEVGLFWRFAGTGGTNFRGLYLAFLHELRERSSDPRLDPCIADFTTLEHHWVRLIEALLGYGEMEDPKEEWTFIDDEMASIADAEERAFERLFDRSSHVIGSPV